MKKRPYLRTIIIGFTVLYVFSMLLVTHLVKEKYSNKYARNYNEMIDALAVYYDKKDPIDMFPNVYPVSYLLTQMDGKYQQFSVAIYDRDNKKCVQLGSTLHFEHANGEIFSASLEDFFQGDELESLLRCYNAKEEWTLETRRVKNTGELYSLRLYVKGEEVSFEWMNPEITKPNADNILIYARAYQSLSQVLNVPYLSQGMDCYETWKKDSFLQNFPKYFKNSSNIASVREEIGWEVHDETYLFLMNTRNTEGTYSLLLRSSTRPLLAAMDELLDIYFITLFLAVICVVGVMYYLNKDYRERAMIVETRRDFTNAIAHELKTPLGIIRNFSENLLENVNAEKEDYYLQQIAKQTKCMEDMRKEMLYVSGLDSESLILKKQPISIRDVIDEQYEKLSPLAEEKNLEISYKESEEFVVNGDKTYLSKAIWNLLSNAIAYNRMDGYIEVKISSGWFSIENSGSKIGKEQLSHVFDMFYTGDESRNSKVKHLGLGLYLSKRILSLHDLTISMYNTEHGVKVMVAKK